MKRLIVLILMALFLAGCGAARESGFYQHDAQYRNFDHLAFSWSGYKNPTQRDARLAQEQNWWGIEVPYIPAR